MQGQHFSRRRLSPLFLSRPALSPLLLALLATAAFQARSQNAAAQEHHKVDEIVRSTHNDVSPPLRDITAIMPATARRGRPVREHRIPFDDGPEHDADPLLERSQGRALPGSGATAVAAPTLGTGVDGVGQGFSGPSGTMTVNSAPPDTTGAVGATQYVQWVNTAFAVFDKTTKAAVYGPADGKTLWSGFGGPCEARNDGDPVVQYDKLANRWVVSQFSVPGGATGYWQCIAVSTTADATGTWNRYAFQYTQFNDFPKMGVWPDAYYVSYNMFTNSFQGSTVCAIDRAKMLAGLPATQQCIKLASTFGSTLPADLDGPAPAAGTPNYVVARAVNSINMWRFKVDWATPANTTLSGPVNVAVAAYSAACAGGNCVTQPGTSNKLDSLADRLNFRAAYRSLNGGTLTLNHAVSTGSKRTSLAAVRWYELRNVAPTGTPTLQQQGTFGGGDGVHRWMGSIAQDKLGNIAVSYSASGAAVFPSLRMASRVPSDAAGTLKDETVLKAGSGAQTGSLTRWGDYSQISVDPVDDCTFWATNEYIKANGSFNWNTWISSFKLPGCN